MYTCHFGPLPVTFRSARDSLQKVREKHNFAAAMAVCRSDHPRIRLRVKKHRPQGVVVGLQTRKCLRCTGVVARLYLAPGPCWRLPDRSDLNRLQLVDEGSTGLYIQTTMFLC